MCLYLQRFFGELDADRASDVSVANDAGHDETVPIVDNEPTVRMLMREVLEEAGYVTLEAADGQSGLKILRTRSRVDTCPLSGEVQTKTRHRAAFSNWNRLVTVLCGRRSNTAPVASKCDNRPNDADSWRNHKNIFAVIFPLKSKA